MKRIGIIFAMKEELEETKKKIELLKEHKIFNLVIYECNFNETQCFLVESGIGKVNAARTTQILISEMKVDNIINVGVAGSVSESVKKCDLVIADKIVQHDFDLTSFNREKGEIPNIGKYIECDKKMLEIAKNISLDSNIFVGIISSGDIFVTEEKMGRKINQKFNALCVEMEGAAIAQVCYLCEVPFIVIRAISDSPYEEDNSITFDDFLKISSEKVSKFVIEFLNKMEVNKND